MLLEYFSEFDVSLGAIGTRLHAGGRAPLLYNQVAHAAAYTFSMKHHPPGYTRRRHTPDALQGGVYLPHLRRFFIV